MIHVAFSSSPCINGVEIVSQETKNPEDLIGNWTYVYHWDTMNTFNKEFVDDYTDHLLSCPGITISAVAPDYVKAKEAECSKPSDANIPFKWSDAKLRVDAPLAKIEGGLIFIGEKYNWMMSDCGHMLKIVMKKVSDNYAVLINPDMGHISEMIAKKPPTLEDLKCVAHNVDIGKGMSGFGLCI